MLTLYATKHGKTKQVAKKFDINAKNISEEHNLKEHDLIIIFCPTYGDEELPLDMENYLNQISEKNKTYIICELGNYYGFDDFTFGAAKIINSQLKKLGWQRVGETLSLDSLPKIDWQNFERWKNDIQNKLSN